MVGDIATDILTVYSGPLAVDSDTAAQVRITGGGSAANTAAWLVQAGVDSVLSGVVGDDDAGAARIAELRAAGVRCAVRRVPGASTGSVVVLSSGTARSMLCDRGANALLDPSDVDAGLPAAHLHLSAYSLFDPRSAPAGEHALRTARALGMTCSVDAGSAAPLARFGRARFLDLVRAADVLFANLDDAGLHRSFERQQALAVLDANAQRGAALKQLIVAGVEQAVFLQAAPAQRGGANGRRENALAREVCAIESQFDFALQRHPR